MKRMYGPGKVGLVKKAQAKAKMLVDGRAGPALDRVLRAAGAYDAFSDALFEQWHRSQVPPKPKLVEPYQGFASLHKSLWEAYSIGRNLGLGDGPGLASGTYNPDSRLPSGRPSDHAVYPAYAFDLDIGADTGWNNLKARLYVQRIAGRKEIEYVILGDRIHTRRGWGKYYSGGHLNHVHASGVR